MYIHEKKDWPSFTWDSELLLTKVSRVRHIQGGIIGRVQAMGFQMEAEAVMETIAEDIKKSSEIEGEFLDVQEVRSSVARGLGMETSGMPVVSRNVEGITEVMLDATMKYTEELTKERLYGWHAALFPVGRSGMQRITVGAWRTGERGEMKVISGAVGKENVHFVAPTAALVDKEMTVFLEWFNERDNMEPVLKSALAHFWFVTIHPFSDGNGRIARAIADMQLARADGTSQRFYSMSSQIMKQRKGYYSMLESSQKGSLDVSQWMVWYLECLERAIHAADHTLSKILAKAKFWEEHRTTEISERQRLMITKLQGDFVGKLTSSKWAKMTKVHRDTARRDIQDLVEKGILYDSGEGGRSTNYVMGDFPS